MPVRKYRDVGEMDRDIWYERGDPRLFRAIRAVWTFAQRIVQPRFPPGVYRFESVEAASEQRRLWEQRNIEAMQLRMKPSTKKTGGAAAPPSKNRYR